MCFTVQYIHVYQFNDFINHLHLFYYKDGHFVYSVHEKVLIALTLLHCHSILLKLNIWSTPNRSQHI